MSPYKNIYISAGACWGSNCAAAFGITDFDSGCSPSDLSSCTCCHTFHQGSFLIKCCCLFNGFCPCCALATFISSYPCLVLPFDSGTD